MIYDRVNSSYEHALACCYHLIDKRGLRFDLGKLQTLRQKVSNEIADECATLSNNWQVYISVGPIKPSPTTLGGNLGNSRACNLNSTSGERSLLNLLKELGYAVPKIRKKNSDGEYESVESTNELALRQIFAESGDPSIKSLLRVRELNKLLTTYINAKLFNGIFFSNYSVAKTVTGRRGSSKHVFGFGGNAQNFPKHSEIASDFRECIISRPGKIFLSVDQMQAEDWPVSALAANQSALQQLRTGVDRHTELASFIFGIPIASRSRDEWKESIERYLGKKARHANNYGMQAKRLSEALAQEGFSVPLAQCKLILERVDQYDPSVKSVFHTYIRSQIEQTRLLRTPLGRERQFFGLRPNSPNYEIFNEAYSYIPQSTVGDNTGLAVLYCSNECDWIVQESHDSIVFEVPDNENDILKAFNLAKKGFTRPLIFHNGIIVDIPIEAELGYSFQGMKKVKDFSEDGLLNVYRRFSRNGEATAAQMA